MATTRRRPRAHTRTTKSGRTVSVNSGVKGRSKAGARGSRWSGPSVTPRQNRDRMYACWSAAGAGAYFGFVHGNWVAASFLGILAVLFGSAYLIGRYRNSTRQSRTIGRRKAKEAASRIWATLRPQPSERRAPSGAPHDAARLEPSKRRSTTRPTAPQPPLLISDEWKDSKPAQHPPAASRTHRHPTPAEQRRENERNRQAAYTRMQEQGARVVRGDGKCAAHPDGFDRDCPSCLAALC